MNDFGKRIANLPNELPSDAYTTQQPLSLKSFSQDPFEQFEEWLTKALEIETLYPHAMSLATATKDGKPSVRTVLLKGIDDKGFIFYTHYTSRKGKELEENPFAAIVFYWPHVYRQVRIEGRVEKLSKEKSDAYFTNRSRDSQINAWASQQSKVIEHAKELEQKVEEMRKKFSEGAIPRPSHWGGYRLLPNRFEFWQHGKNRFHDRIAYEFEQGLWAKFRLSP